MRGVKILWGVVAVFFGIQTIAPCTVFAGSDGYFTSSELRAMDSAGYTQTSSSNNNNGAVSFTSPQANYSSSSSSSSSYSAPSAPVYYYADDPLPVSSIDYTDPEQNVYINLDTSYSSNRDYVQAMKPGTPQFIAENNPAPVPAAAPVVTVAPQPAAVETPKPAVPAVATSAVSQIAHDPVLYYDPVQKIYITDKGNKSEIYDASGKQLSVATGVSALDEQYWAGLERVTGVPKLTTPLLGGPNGLDVKNLISSPVPVENKTAAVVKTTATTTTTATPVAATYDSVTLSDSQHGVFYKVTGATYEAYNNKTGALIGSGKTADVKDYLGTLPATGATLSQGSGAVSQTIVTPGTTVVTTTTGPQDTRIKHSPETDGITATVITENGKEIGQRLVYRDGSLAIWINNQQVYYNNVPGSAYDYYTARDLLKGGLGRPGVTGAVPDYQKVALYSVPVGDLELDSSIGNQPNFGSLIFTDPNQSQLYTSETTGKSFTLRGEFNADGKLSGYVWSWKNDAGETVTRSTSGATTVNGVSTTKPATTAAATATPASSTPAVVTIESAVKKMASQHDILWTVSSSGTDYTLFSADKQTKHILTFQYDKATDEVISGNSADYKWSIPAGKTAYEWVFVENKPL